MTVNYSAPVINPSVCLSVCVYVCLSVSISLEPLDWSSQNLVCRSPVAMARSSSGGVAIHYVLPVLWMTSRLAVVGTTPKRGGCTMQRLPWAARRYRGGVWCLWMRCFDLPLAFNQLQTFGVTVLPVMIDMRVLLLEYISCLLAFKLQTRKIGTAGAEVWEKGKLIWCNLSSYVLNWDIIWYCDLLLIIILARVQWCWLVEAEDTC